MHADEEDLTVFYLTIRVFEVHLPCTKALDLCAGKSNAAFKPLVYEIIVKGFYLFMLKH